MTRAFVGLGSNLGDREATILRSLARLQAEPELRVVRVSTLRETDPVGYADQPRFLNGVVELETELPARALLGRLLTVERNLGRTRGEGPPLGPRTIDLDLLLYGDATIAEAGLQLPHPRLHERRFVLEPLAELAPDVVVPGHGPVGTLLAELES
ncbi:MAG: 2-amino-4-hydroxy-6-hydroxymethyldihydropteridine diphosphokinase [Actinomycetota bacterium]|nr:2-amino-4-hydroxy-6-hydroxymethyldihydropteridine diphosphokinase [Actinomycetota bacterium]